MRIFLTFFVLLITGFSAVAIHNPIIYGPSNILGFSTDIFYRLRSFYPNEQYRIVQNPDQQTRVEDIINYIHLFSGHKFYNDFHDVYILNETSGEPNAWSTGRSVFITNSLLKILSDRELTAVLAHELAHEERAHLLRRLAVPIGSIVIAAYNAIKGSGKTAPSVIIEEFRTGTEIEADCIAAKWLLHMRDLGLKNDPEDLLAATEKILVKDYFMYLDANDAPVLRYYAIKNKVYMHDACGL